MAPGRAGVRQRHKADMKRECGAGLEAGPAFLRGDKIAGLTGKACQARKSVTTSGFIVHGNRMYSVKRNRIPYKAVTK